MKTSHTLSFLLLLTACSEIPSATYFNRGDPENLLDVSSEVVNLNLTSASSLGELSNMVSQDPPTRAELNCNSSDGLCMEARQVFEQYNIPVQSGGAGSGVTLVYERVVARDCENRYIDNSVNPYNLHPPTFGCSITGNMVQMVSDKRQFTNPNLLDFQDGEKAVQTYRGYLKPPPPPSEEEESQIQSLSSE